MRPEIFKYVKDSESYSKLAKEYGYLETIYRRTTKGDIELADHKKGRLYTTHNPYYCSWLSIYPEKTVELGLIVELLDGETPDEYECRYNSEFFNITLDKLSEMKSLSLNQPKGIDKGVNIACLKGFNSHRKIEIYSIKGEKKRLAGQMYVWANDASKQKKANILFIPVTTVKSQNNTNSVNQKTAKKEKVGKYEDNTTAEDYLKQALIEIKDEKISLDMFDDINFKPLNMSNPNLGTGRYICEGGLLAYYSPGMYVPPDYIPLHEYLNTKLEDELEKKANRQTSTINI